EPQKSTRGTNRNCQEARRPRGSASSFLRLLCFFAANLLSSSAAQLRTFSRQIRGSRLVLEGAPSHSPETAVDRHPQPPDESVLRRFLAGELTGPELDSVADYLELHPEAAAALSSLTVSDTLLSALKSAEEDTDSPELSALVARMASLGAAEAPSTPQP